MASNENCYAHVDNAIYMIYSQGQQRSVHTAFVAAIRCDIFQVFSTFDFTAESYILQLQQLGMRRGRVEMWRGKLSNTMTGHDNPKLIPSSYSSCDFSKEIRQSRVCLSSFIGGTIKRAQITAAWGCVIIPAPEALVDAYIQMTKFHIQLLQNKSDIFMTSLLHCQFYT